MQYNENITEALAVCGQLAPVSLSAATHEVGPVNMAKFRRLLAVINVGVLGSSSTIDAHFTTSSTSGGSYTTLASSDITQITSGATNLVLLELRAETLAAANVGPYVKLEIVVGTAASLVSAEIFGSGTYYPSSDYNVVTPTQVLVD